jgi:hypothetical protein
MPHKPFRCKLVRYAHRPQDRLAWQVQCDDGYVSPLFRSKVKARRRLNTERGWRKRAGIHAGHHEDQSNY